MYENGKIYMGLADDQRVELALNMCNRHGLIAGASGTGKTITMKVMAESFSDAGVPVFLCDVKGDVAGICAPGVNSEGMEKRIDKFGVRDTFTYKAYPTTFWDIYQEGGHAVRATVSDMGPELLSRILGLTPAQEGILHIVFRIADDKGLLLIDLKDLRAMLTYVNEHRSEYMMTYGNITSQSVAAILRALLPLEQQGGDLFFGEPALDIRDWMRTDADGHGMINVLDCVKLVQNPTLYAGFLLWMLSELFEDLPEAAEYRVPCAGKAELVFTDSHGTELSRQTVFDFSGPGVLQAMHNRDDSILAFARACFTYALDMKQDLWFSAKDTISKDYDQTFKLLFQKVFDEEFRSAFEQAGLQYRYCLIDDAVARVIRSSGGIIWACKNYDGDVMSDLIASASGSLAMMTSVLVSPDGNFEYEAAHGTVTAHFYRWRKGEKVSTNPMATMAAWAGALKKRGELDGNRELIRFADCLYRSGLDVFEEGYLPKDLAPLCDPAAVREIPDTERLISLIRHRLEALLGE